MKMRITLAMACFIGFVLLFDRGGLLSRADRARVQALSSACRPETLSGNTIGAKFYTDGKRKAEICCQIIPGWRSVRVRAASLGWMKRWRWTPASTLPKESSRSWLPQERKCWSFFPGRQLPADKELYVRVLAWRSANDAWRWNPNATPAFSKEQVQNLKSLSKMLDETEPNQQILKAEIARELGEFDECLRLLSHPFDERYGYAVGFIRKLAQEKVLVVRSISPVK